MGKEGNTRALYMNNVISRKYCIKESSSPVQKANFLQKLAELPDNLLWEQTLAKLLPVPATGAPGLMSLGGHGERALKRQRRGDGSVGSSRQG